MSTLKNESTYELYKTHHFDVLTEICKDCIHPEKVDHFIYHYSKLFDASINNQASLENLRKNPINIIASLLKRLQTIGHVGKESLDPDSSNLSDEIIPPVLIYLFMTCLDFIGSGTKHISFAHFLEKKKLEQDLKKSRDELLENHDLNHKEIALKLY